MDAKDFRELEERLNKMFNDPNMDATAFEEMFSIMQELKLKRERVKINFHYDDDGVKVSVGAEEYIDIEVMSKAELKERLADLEEELEELENEEPDDSDDEAYGEWEDRMDELEEEIDEIKKQIEQLREAELNLTLTGASCITEEYRSFAKIAKPVFVDGACDTALVEYLAQNENVKNSVLDICNLILATNSVSISLIQRKLNMGYNKAGTIVDMLETLGAVTSFNGLNSRKVKREQLLKLKAYVE